MQTDRNDDRPLAGRVVIVTGAGSGIGRATCGALARSGATIVAVGRTLARLRETLEHVERNAGGSFRSLPLPLDVRLEDDMAGMAHRTLEEFGRIDALIASAGVLRATRKGPTPIVDLPLEEWRAVLDTNLRGTFLSNRAVVPVMTRQKSGDIKASAVQ